jgi:hypothetical protein
MKPDYSRIPTYTLKTLGKWIATGRLDDDNAAEAVFFYAIRLQQHI